MRNNMLARFASATASLLGLRQASTNMPQPKVINAKKKQSAEAHLEQARTKAARSAFFSSWERRYRRLSKTKQRALNPRAFPSKGKSGAKGEARARKEARRRG